MVDHYEVSKVCRRCRTHGYDQTVSVDRDSPQYCRRVFIGGYPVAGSIERWLKLARQVDGYYSSSGCEIENVTYDAAAHAGVGTDIWLCFWNVVRPIGHLATEVQIRLATREQSENDRLVLVGRKVKVADNENASLTVGDDCGQEYSRCGGVQDACYTLRAETGVKCAAAVDSQDVDAFVSPVGTCEDHFLALLKKIRRAKVIELQV